MGVGVITVSLGGVCAGVGLEGGAQLDGSRLDAAGSLPEVSAL